MERNCKCGEVNCCGREEQKRLVCGGWKNTSSFNKEEDSGFNCKENVKIYLTNYKNIRLVLQQQWTWY